MKEQFEKNNIKDKIMFSLLSNGFCINQKYGNKETNYFGFDIRNDNKIMDLIEKSKSFITTTIKKDKEYKIVGLALNILNPQVEKLSNEQRWTTSGRNGYIFAVIENTPNLPNNINDILEQNAIESAKSFFYQIKDWDNAIKKPIEII